MNIVTLDTTQNISIEYPLASLGDRILANLLDLAFQIAYVVVAVLLMNWMDLLKQSALLYLLLAIPILFYHLACEVFMNGQSFGKKIMKCRVMSMDGGAPTLGQYLIRWIFRLVDFSLSSRIVALVTVATTPKNQRLGDLVARTIVVKTSMGSEKFSTQLPVYTEEEYVPHYPTVSQLSASEIQLVRDVLINVRQTHNTMLALDMSDKLENLIAVKRKEDPVSFLENILADYRQLK